MSASDVETIRRFHATLAPSILDGEVARMLAGGFPAGGRHRGRRAVFEEWWPRHAALFSAWQAVPEALLYAAAPASGTPPDAGEAAVVALGRHRGVARGSGRAFGMPFAHVWRLREGRIVALSQHMDTLLPHRALAPEGPGSAF